MISFLVCGQCRVSKARTQFFPDGVNDEYKAWCLQCLLDYQGESDDMRWCHFGSHEDLQYAFRFNGQEFSTCNQCTKRNLVDAPLAVPTLDDKAVSNEHWKLIESFHLKLDQLEQCACNVCNEIDFEMGIRTINGVDKCQRCRTDWEKTSNDTVGKFSIDNDMDPGAVPFHLPHLFMAEEMLIARAHVLMNFRRVRGCQYKYSGHVVNFMQNTAKIINWLPSLPTELQVIILKPSSASAKDSAPHQAFANTFRVRRKNVEVWLNFLVVHHLDYQNIMVDQERLSQLPEDETVMDELETVVHDKEEGESKEKGIGNKSNSSTQVKENTPVPDVNPLGMSYECLSQYWFRARYAR